jgi:hypothetical protein
LRATTFITLLLVCCALTVTVDGADIRNIVRVKKAIRRS